MRSMTKSAVRVAHEALAVGRRTFPAYGSRTSRPDFTQSVLNNAFRLGPLRAGCSLSGRWLG